MKKDRKVIVNVNVDADDYEALASRDINVSEAVRRGIAAVVEEPTLIADVVANLIKGAKDDDKSKQ